MIMYYITKINALTGEEKDYGLWGYEDMKTITKGYTFNGMFYDRKNSNWFFMVKEINK